MTRVLKFSGHLGAWVRACSPPCTLACFCACLLGGRTRAPCLLAPFLPCSLAPLLPCSLAPLLPCSLAPLLPFSLAPLLPCSLAPLLPCSLAPLLPFSLAPLLPCSLAPLLACSLARLLACSLARLLACSLACLLACSLAQRRSQLPVGEELFGMAPDGGDAGRRLPGVRGLEAECEAMAPGSKESQASET